MTLSFCLNTQLLARLGDEPAGVTMHISAVKDDGSVDVVVDGEEDGVQRMARSIRELVLAAR